MSDTKSDHLYVMQASTGRIKIGRSADPRRRRLALQTSSGQQVALIAVLEGQGHREREIHRKLAVYRGIGEWFLCTKKAKAAICEAVALDLRFHRHRNHLDAAIEQERLTLQAEEKARKIAAKEAASQEKIAEAIERAFADIRQGRTHKTIRSPLRERALNFKDAYHAGRATLERVNEAMALAGLPPIDR